MSSVRRAVIRADAAPAIGSGHIMRMLTLAQALAKTGTEITFLSRRRPGDLHDRILAAGFNVEALSFNPQASDAWLGAEPADEMREVRAIFQRLAPLDLIVVDHYSLDSGWERVAAQFAPTVMALEDREGREHACSILLDQNVGADRREGYAKLVPAGTKLLLGPKYALLREEFRGGRLARAGAGGKVERILVFMGGFDVCDQTTKVLNALDAIADRPLVDVVLPQAAPSAESVAARCSVMEGVEYLGAVENIAERMRACDFSIGAGGTTTWERCAVGLPVVLLTLADNQREGAMTIAQSGAGLSLGDADTVCAGDIAAAVRGLLHEPGRIGEMSQNAFALVGGDENNFGTDAVIRAISVR